MGAKRESEDVSSRSAWDGGRYLVKRPPNKKAGVAAGFRHSLLGCAD
jgi:hypothetical protein